MAQNTRCEGQQLSLREGFERSSLTLDQAWTEYLVMGGVCSRVQVIAALRGEGMSVPYEHDKLAAALNETFIDAGHDYRVAYSEVPDADVG